MKQAVAYIRVSAERDNSSVHSTATQRSIIEDYSLRNGIEVVKWFVETNVSGGNDDRIELHKCVKIAHKKGYSVIVKDLSRLSRTAHTCLQLLSSLNVIDCTLGINADEKVLMMMALMGDWERKATSTRMLQMYDYLRKTQPNRIFGNAKTLVEGRKTSMKNRQSKADAFAQRLEPLVMTDETLQQICDKLMTYGITTARGGTVWKPTMVMRLRKRLQNLTLQ